MGTPDAGAGTPDAGPGASDAGAPATTGDCSTTAPPRVPAGGGWEWENPLPQGYTLRAAWAASASDVWAAGDHGALTHWNGRTWSATSGPVDQSLLSMWGTGSGDVWAGGISGAILHFDGKGWSASESATQQPVRSIWAAGATDAWALAYPLDMENPSLPFALVHWDGLAWSTQAPPSADAGLHLSALAGFAANDLWVGGCASSSTPRTVYDALLFHWDGASWTRMTTGGAGCVMGIAGTRSDDIWATTRVHHVCDDGYGHWWFCPTFEMAHWDGKTWAAAQVPAGVLATSITAAAPGEIWAQNSSAVYRWTGTDWSTVADLQHVQDRSWPGPGPWAIAGSSPDDIWLAGSDGRIHRWDGSHLKNFSGLHEGAYAMWGVAEKDLWAVGNRTILHGSCGSWSATDVSQHLPSSENGLSAVWGSAGDDVWAVGFGVALHWDGVSWKKVPTPATIEQTSVWGSGPKDVYAGGYQGLFHYDGTAWSPVLGGEFEWVYAIWGSAATDVWVATNYYRYAEDAYANVYHFDGATWTRTVHLWIAAGEGRIISLSGTGRNDVWAMGEARSLHWDGRSWTTQETGLTPGYYSAWNVWARAPDDVWATPGVANNIGANAIHFDGKSWSQVWAPEAYRFFSLPNGPVWNYGTGILRHP